MKDTVSLPIAKKLKEAGWAQEAVGNSWWWAKLPSGSYVETFVRNDHETGHEYLIAAPTIGSLLEALPWCWLEKEDGKGYEAVQGEVWSGWNPNPADALALLYIELKKKGLV